MMADDELRYRKRHNIIVHRRLMTTAIIIILVYSYSMLMPTDALYDNDRTYNSDKCVIYMNEHISIFSEMARISALV